MKSEEIEYLKDLIEQLESDKKYTLLFITFNIAILTLVTNGIVLNTEPISLNLFEKIIMSTAMFLIFIGTIAFLKWYVELHILRIKKTDLFLTKDISEARKTHYPGNDFFKNKSLIFLIGSYSTGIAIFLFVIEIMYRIWM